MKMCQKICLYSASRAVSDVAVRFGDVRLGMEMCRKISFCNTSCSVSDAVVKSRWVSIQGEVRSVMKMWTKSMFL